MLPLTDSVTAQASATLLAFDRTTLVRVTITGSVSSRLTPYNDGNPNSPPSPGERTFGPNGYYWGSAANNGCGAGVYVAWSLGGSRWPACAPDGSTDGVASVVVHLYAKGSGSAVRTAVAPGTTGTSCFYYAPNFFSGYGPCFYYSTSGQSVTVERVTAQFQLTPSQINAEYRDTVDITASVSPGTVDGKEVPFTIDSTRWVPGDGANPQQKPCEAGGFLPSQGPSRTCRAEILKKGTLTVYATVNNAAAEKSVVIDIANPAELKISPDPVEAYQGDVLTFSASANPPTTTRGVAHSVQVTGWWWKHPSAGSDPTQYDGPICNASPTCQTGVLLTKHTGAKVRVFGTVDGVPDTAETTVTVTKIAQLVLTPNPATRLAGQTATFTASISPTNRPGTNTPIPFQVLEWRWVHPQFTGNACAAGGGTQCMTGVLQAQHTGAKVWVIALVNGVRDSTSSTIYVVPCLTGDTLADNAEVRLALIAQQDSSKNELLERGGSIARNIVTGKDTVIHHPSSDRLFRGDCGVGWNNLLPQLPSGYVRVAIFHTHWKTPQTTCNYPSGYTAGIGLSTGDWIAARLFRCPHYVIDEKVIYKVNPYFFDREAAWKNRKVPPRWVDRDPFTNKCKTWPAFLAGEDDLGDFCVG